MSCPLTPEVGPKRCMHPYNASLAQANSQRPAIRAPPLQVNDLGHRQHTRQLVTMAILWRQCVQWVQSSSPKVAHKRHREAWPRIPMLLCSRSTPSSSNSALPGSTSHDMCNSHMHTMLQLTAACMPCHASGTCWPLGKASPHCCGPAAASCQQEAWHATACMQPEQQ